MERYDKLKLLDGLEAKRYLKGDTVLKEGDEADNFYIIEEGEVECLKNEEDPSLPKIHVRDLQKGEHFGELALINNGKRTLSVVVKSDHCKLLALGRDTFSRILGNISRFLKKDYDGKFDKEFEKTHETEVTPNQGVPEMKSIGARAKS
jgi:cAMP-dependent protein kinase regulator